MFTQRSCLPIVASLWMAAPVQAQWAVVDAPAIVQLVQEVQTLQQAVQTAHEQLNQAQQALRTMTGTRGMELLLGGTSRNYLPASWQQIAAAQAGGGSNPGLAAGLRNAVGANGVLTAQQLAALPPAARRHIDGARQSGALQQTLAQEALANTSGRFAAIQTLIAAIPNAGDQKAILDLQARIGAELGMLQNEQTKLQVLHQATQAEDAVHRQQEREAVIAGHGQFESRFRPTP